MDDGGPPGSTADASSMEEVAWLLLLLLLRARLLSDKDSATVVELLVRSGVVEAEDATVVKVSLRVGVAVPTDVVSKLRELDPPPVMADTEELRFMAFVTKSSSFFSSRSTSSTCFVALLLRSTNELDSRCSESSLWWTPPPPPPPMSRERSRFPVVGVAAERRPSRPALIPLSSLSSLTFGMDGVDCAERRDLDGDDDVRREGGGGGGGGGRSEEEKMEENEADSSLLLLWLSEVRPDGSNSSVAMGVRGDNGGPLKIILSSPSGMLNGDITTGGDNAAASGVDEDPRE